MFEHYKEPSILLDFVSYFGMTSTFLIWLIPLICLQVSFFYKYKFKIPTIALLALSAIIVYLNYKGIVLNLIFIALAYIYAIYHSVKYIHKKSIKWINISMLMLCLTILTTYVFFNYKVQQITYVYFITNDIDYKFSFKPFFEIFKQGDVLNNTDFKLDGTKISIDNTDLASRIYGFFYVLNTIGLLVWLFIYKDVLKKHSFNFKKEETELKN